MKHFYSKIAFLGICLTLLFANRSFSTNVTGGIFSNTIWTVANSPYIVSDTVVVFSSVSLTIEAGVVVKFNNNAIIDVRGNFYAAGTASDSIIFTSNASTPHAGIYGGIELESGTDNAFSYCSFYYATTAISGLNGNPQAPPISHCQFNSNITGIDNLFGINIDTSSFNYDSTGISQSWPETYIIGCTFSYNGKAIQMSGGPLVNCTFSHNNTGIWGSLGQGTISNCTFDSNKILGLRASDDSIVNCTITNNGVGIESEECQLISNNISYNNIGIETIGDRAITCNNICSNTTYNIENEESTDVNINNNYWCLTDSASIQATIYDGHKNLSLGLLNFMPFNSGSCIVGDTSKHCKAAFTLFPDSLMSHFWYALNQSTGKGPINYTWYWGDGDSSTASGNISHQYAAAGYYTICVSMLDDSGCASRYCDTSVYLSRMEQGNTMFTVNVVSSITTGTAAIAPQANNIVLYPNPVTDKLLVKGNLPLNSSINISNVLGQTVFNQTANPQNNELAIDVSNLKAGVYFILLSSGQGNTIRKFVKE